MDEPTTLACVACQREDVTTLVCMVLRDGEPAPVCANCFGTLCVQVAMSGALGCGGCLALREAFDDLLDQLDQGSLPLSANPHIAHSPSCLLR